MFYRATSDGGRQVKKAHGISDRVYNEMLKPIQHDKVWNETFNAVAPNHPTRKNYYTEKAITLNLPQPEFSENEPSIGKIVSSEKLEKVLGYGFRNLGLD